MSIRRRDFLVGAASVGLNMPLRIPYGPGPFDPRQPMQQRVLPPPYKTLPYTMQPSASPVHLSAALQLAPGVSGSVSPAALRNPMGLDMELLEIKFELSGPGSGNAATIYGGSIWADLMLGSIKLTNGSVPVWNFGRAENLRGESKSDSTDLLSFSSYSWRLPRPLFIPAGAVVIPKFNHTGFLPNTINVRVSYSCRTVFTQPKKIYVPWVAKYASKAFNPIEAADVDSSSELDLVNSNPEVVHLQRLVGRTQTLRTNLSSTENTQYLSSQYLTMRMTDSYGRPVVRFYTPFGSVFSALTRSWEMDNTAELDPEAFYKVQIKKDALTLAGGSADTAAVAQAFISMVGWRELPGTSGISAALTPLLPEEENP